MTQQRYPTYQDVPVIIYNSKHRTKEQFEALHAPKVGMYVCGPTVYGDPHLGHARAAVAFDTVFRYLSHLGYQVRYVRNITDVGHMEDEVNEGGEDKIAKKARLEKLEPMEIAHHYTVSYHDAMGALNCLPPSIEPTATGHIPEQIELVEKILQNGYGYEVNGSVYFDLEKYAETGSYGELSGKVLKDLRSGTRATEGLTEKHSSLDFALWKRADESHLMQWESPWGRGFPGWHLECTTMSTKYLGTTFDIHGGGIDLQFPHHEAEIAQNHGAYGRDPARYWIHNNMLTVDGQKMAKSLGNFITMKDLFSGNHERLEKGFSPQVVRFFMLQAQYRSVLDFSSEALVAAEKGLKRLLAGLETLRSLKHPRVTEGTEPLPLFPAPGESEEESLQEEMLRFCRSMYLHMSDDFNTARVLADLFEIMNRINAVDTGSHSLEELSPEAFLRIRTTVEVMVSDVLGIEPEAAVGENRERLDELVRMLIEVRGEARKKKDFATADQIRDRLKEIGIQLEDRPDGTTDYTMV